MTPTAPTDPIPLRALNQVTYCPRLYYLEYVEGLMRNNEHVEDGLFQHRRINSPELELRERTDGDRTQTRSVSVGSDITLSTPRMLFEQRYAFGISVASANYDVSADGQRFLMLKDESGGSRLNLVLNWFEELKAKVPTAK